jgi:hypothetical protein
MKEATRRYFFCLFRVFKSRIDAWQLNDNLEGSGRDKGRAIAQAVSRWLPTAVARIRAWVWSCGICGGQSGAGAGAGFMQVLRFPLPIFVPPIAPQSSSSIIWDLYVQ